MPEISIIYMKSVESISLIPEKVVVEPGRRQMTSNTPHSVRYGKPEGRIPLAA